MMIEPVWTVSRIRVQSEIESHDGGLEGNREREGGEQVICGENSDSQRAGVT